MISCCLTLLEKKDIMNAKRGCLKRVSGKILNFSKIIGGPSKEIRNFFTGFFLEVLLSDFFLAFFAGAAGFGFSSIGIHL
jgi:hypothetical protein